MYITYKLKNYPCTCTPSSKQMAYIALPEDFPAPVDGEIVLCADDGFVMRTDNPADYLRQTFEGGVLMLTNVPEPAPAPVVEPTQTEKREAAYNTEKVIEWDGEMLTVTEAAQLWQYYAAEGSEKAADLTVLIAEAKAKIRGDFPESEAQV